MSISINRGTIRLRSWTSHLIRTPLLGAVVLALSCRDSTVPSVPSLSPSSHLFETSEGCTNCVVGPLTLVRGDGTPRIDRFTFAGDPQADYVLMLDDGESLGSVAVVRLNGHEILRANTLAGAPRTASLYRLSANPSNTVEVILAGRPGSHVAVRVLSGAKVVGAEGDRVASPSQEFAIDFPPSALGVPTLIQIAPATPTLPSSNSQVPLRTFHLLPEGQVFGEPVVATWRTSTFGSGPSTNARLAVAHFSESGDHSEIATSAFDSGRETLTFTLRSFSLTTAFWSSSDSPWQLNGKRWTVRHLTYAFENLNPAGYTQITPALVRQALEEWAAATNGFSFELAADPTSANIRVQDLGYIPPSLFCATAGSTTPNALLGNTCLPKREDTFDGSTSIRVQVAGERVRKSSYLYGDEPGSAYKNLRHEIGHALGLDHPIEDDLDEPIMTQGVKPRVGLHPWDVAGIQALYGPAARIATVAPAPTSITIGTSPLYTVTLSNAGPNALTSVFLRARIQQGSAYREAGNGPFTCVPGGTTGTLPVGNCTFGRFVFVGNTTTGTGSLFPDNATLVLELYQAAGSDNSNVLDTRALPVTLVSAVTGLSVVPDEWTTYPGTSVLASATVTAPLLVNKSVSFVSSNPSIVAVTPRSSTSATLTALGLGTATVTVTALSDPSFTVAIPVTIGPPPLPTVEILKLGAGQVFFAAAANTADIWNVFDASMSVHSALRINEIDLLVNDGVCAFARLTSTAATSSASSVAVPGASVTFSCATILAHADGTVVPKFPNGPATVRGRVYYEEYGTGNIASVMSSPISITLNNPAKLVPGDQALIQDLQSVASCSAGSARSLYQSLTPSRSTISAVELLLRAGESFPVAGTSTTIRVRAGSANGPILGTATTPVRGVVEGDRVIVTFRFTTPLTVTPGGQTFIEWTDADRPAVLAWVVSASNPYAGGTMFGCDGAAIPASDLNFRTYSPTP